MNQSSYLKGVPDPVRGVRSVTIIVNSRKSEGVIIAVSTEGPPTAKQRNLTDHVHTLARRDVRVFFLVNGDDLSIPYMQHLAATWLEKRSPWETYNLNELPIRGES